MEFSIKNLFNFLTQEVFTYWSKVYYKLNKKLNMSIDQ